MWIFNRRYSLSIKKFRDILLELNEEYLDYIKNEEESFIEKFLIN